MKIGFNSGIVISLNVLNAPAPSTVAASKISSSIPITPLINNKVVLPNHMIKLINPIKIRFHSIDAETSNGSLSHPHSVKIFIIGPCLDNNVMNKKPNAAAMIKFGI